MEKTLSIVKVGSGTVALRDESAVLYEIRDHTVFRDGEPIWRLVHQGMNLFSGTWKITTFPDNQPVASYRYIPSSYRYGEDLKIFVHELEQDLLFRRIDAEEDRWILLSHRGEIILESIPATASESGEWELRLEGQGDDSYLWPVICLLIFDRVVCDRL